MSTNVFTYGSLMFPEVWNQVVAGSYASVRATLCDHARFAVVDETYPGMVESPGAQVDGLLYLDVDDADVARLDRFEGDDYLRVVVRLDCADGVVRAGDTYRYHAIGRLLPAAWDPDAFAMQRFIDTYCRDKLGG